MDGVGCGVGVLILGGTCGLSVLPKIILNSFSQFEKCWPLVPPPNMCVDTPRFPREPSHLVFAITHPFSPSHPPPPTHTHDSQP